MTYEKCPEEFYENCRNKFKCTRCAAGEGAQHLLYLPIDESPSLKTHPYKRELERLKKRGKEANRRGRQEEKKTLQRLGSKLVRATIGSGAVRGDADATLLDVGQIEHKARKHVSLPLKDIEKGQRQGVKVWALTTPHGVFYVMEEDTFVNLTAHYRNQNKDVRP